MAVQAATPEAIEAAATAVREVRLVAFPTETVYGLGADATMGARGGRIRGQGAAAVQSVDRACRSIEAVGLLGQLTNRATLAGAFWPGR